MPMVADRIFLDTFEQKSFEFFRDFSHKPEISRHRKGSCKSFEVLRMAPNWSLSARSESFFFQRNIKCIFGGEN